MKKNLNSKHPVLGNSIFLRKLESHNGHGWHCVDTWDEQGSPPFVAPAEQTHFCILHSEASYRSKHCSKLPCKLVHYWAWWNSLSSSPCIYAGPSASVEVWKHMKSLSLLAQLPFALMDCKQASSALHERRVFNHKEILSFSNWYKNYDAAITPHSVGNLQKWKKRPFSTKSMSHCRKESWLKSWPWSLAVLCRNHNQLKIQFIGKLKYGHSVFQFWLNRDKQLSWRIINPKDLGAEDMAQQVKCLPYKHENLGLDPQNPYKRLAQWHMLANLALR